MNKQKQEFELVQVEGIPVSAAVEIIRPDRYGAVEGLDKSELADPNELERQVCLKEFGPILALPVKNKWHGPRPEIDENGQVEWGAFGTIDFSRIKPEFNKARYKIDKLKEELRDTVIMMSTIKDRIPGREKYVVLKNLKLGYLDLDNITDSDMWFLGRRYLKYLRLKREIEQLKGYRR